MEKKPVPLSVFDKEVAELLSSDQIKTEELTDSQNDESESGIPAKKSRRRSRAASTSTGEQSPEKSSPVKRNNKQTQQLDTPVRAAGIKLKIKPMAERLSSSISEEKDSKVSSSKKKQQDKKRKSGGNKLIVSFKKKASERKSNVAATYGDIGPENDDVKPDIKSLNITPADTGGDNSGKKSSGHHHPKKKKKKKKLDSKNQKVIEIKTFDEVHDQNIVKVKKKKIYKKRKGSKVLVRIIKNHCNVANEVVKMETVAVDSVPVSDGEGDTAVKEGGEKTSSSSFGHAVDEEEDDEEDDDEDDIVNENGEMTHVDQGIDPNDEEWEPGHDEDSLYGPKSKRSKKALEKTKQKNASGKNHCCPCFIICVSQREKVLAILSIIPVNTFNLPSNVFC